MRYLVTGATGFIGRRLIKDIRNSIVLSRDPDRAKRLLGPDAEYYAWTPVESPAPSAALAKADVVVHMAGEPLAGGRLTPERKATIVRSRVAGTRHLVEGIRGSDPRPKLLVSASAIGYYGDRGDEVLTEESAPGEDFLADLCQQWEAEARSVEELGVRAVLLRNGLVLGRDGGFLSRLLVPFQLGLGGRLGSGEQWMSWVHCDDVLGLIHHAVHDEELRGPVNAVSPRPIPNREFTRVLASHLNRPAFFMVPETALKLAFGGDLSSVMLASQRVEPREALEHGYQFVHSNLDSALRAALGSASGATSSSVSHA
jgi:uncharacterized protein (TIGR01777 family)